MRMQAATQPADSPAPFEFGPIHIGQTRSEFLHAWIGGVLVLVFHEGHRWVAMRGRFTDVTCDTDVDALAGVLSGLSHGSDSDGAHV